MSDFNFTKDQIQADDAKYAALAAELAEPDADLASKGVPHPTWSDDDASKPRDAGSSVDDGGGDEDADRQQRIAEAQDQADRAWQAYLEAREQRGPAPELHSDPLGYVQQLGTQVQQVVAEQQQRNFINAVAHSEEQIRQTTPDYDDACQHLESVRMAQLEMTYPDDDPRAHVLARQYGMSSPAQLRTAVLNQDRVAVAQMALTRGQSPAQFYYDLAVKSGYRSAQQTIDTARRGQRASGNYASSEHKASKRTPTAKQLTQLYVDDPEAFDREWDRYAKAQRAQR